MLAVNLRIVALAGALAALGSPLVAAVRGSARVPSEMADLAADQPIRPTPRPCGVGRPVAASGREGDPSTSPSLVPGCSLSTDQ